MDFLTESLERHIHPEILPSQGEYPLWDPLGPSVGPSVAVVAPGPHMPFPVGGAYPGVHTVVTCYQRGVRTCHPSGHSGVTSQQRAPEIRWWDVVGGYPVIHLWMHCAYVPPPPEGPHNRDVPSL
jgi:hypothetical protein